MPKATVFTLELDPSLHEAFMAEAAAADRPASLLVREFMRAFVQQQRAAREHDAWLGTAIEHGVQEADDAAIGRVPHDDVMDKVKARLETRIAQASKRAD